MTAEFLMDIIRKKGFDFGFAPEACDDCPGHCCCGESGHVWVSQPEFQAICSFLRINHVDCLGQYFNRIDNKLSVKELPTNQGLACTFFAGQGQGCRIYAVRPEQCRSYPFWKHFKTSRDIPAGECPGIRP